MNELKRAFQTLSQNKRIKAEIERARDEFGYKPFAVAYRPLAVTAHYSRLGLALFSICTGFGCLYFGMAAVLPPVVAAGLAGLVLLLVEVAKGQLLYVGFRESYANARPSPILLAALVFTGASVYLSLKGVETLYLRADTSGQVLQTGLASQADSLSRAHDGRIAGARAELEAFKKSISWKGKINMYNPANAAVVKQMTERVALLESDKRGAGADFAARRSSALLEQSERAGFNVALWVGLSGANEALILVFVWFGVYYRYRIASDADLVESTSPVHLTPAHLRQLMEAVSLQAPALPPYQDAQIGFKLGQQKPPDNGPGNGPRMGKAEAPNTVQMQAPNTGQNSANTPFKGIQDALKPTPEREAEIRELQAFLAKYPAVVQMVKEGVGPAKTSRACKVSTSTVHNVKRCMVVLDGYGVGV
jgi:hypothetical protein